MLLYLHIPFCHRICPYCSFYKHTPGATAMGAFVDAMLDEARSRVRTPPRTLYVGGGTPSMLSPTLLRRLFSGLRESIDFATLEEVTLEANPATFDAAKARLFRELGITRVSLGIQSFDAAVLHTLGREHDPEQATESFHVLRAAGVPSINIDLMFSIPGQSMAMWDNTLRHTLALQPDHISAYNLTYEEDTAFFESLKRGDHQADEDRDAGMFHHAEALLTPSGYAHYETSNYARPGHQSRHNLGYWQGEDYLGLGPSAVSTVANTRSTNIADTVRYVQMVGSLGHATADSEALDAEDMRIERVALGLRTARGIPLDLLTPAGLALAHAYAGENLCSIQGERLVAIGRGRALVDTLAAELLV